LIDIWRQKTSPWDITWRCLRDPTFNRFDTIPACDRQTHRLGDNAHGSSIARWKAHCRLPLTITELYTLALTAAALLSEICRNRLFLKGWVTFSANFR